MNRHQLYDKYKRNQEAKRFYNSAAWLKVRELALIRDNYLCQECLDNKLIAVADVVHHMKPLRDYPKLGLVLENLESLCHSCHNNKHSDENRTRDNKKTNINVVKMDGNEEWV